MLGQDIIDHLLKTYPESYRKVFHAGQGRQAAEDDTSEDQTRFNATTIWPYRYAFKIRFTSTTQYYQLSYLRYERCSR